MESTRDSLARLAAESKDRVDLWTAFVRERSLEVAAEIGVYRGHFAQRLLEDCPALTRYYLVDPWRHLDDWNKPANRADDVFEGFLTETLERTQQQADKRVVLRGKTTEVLDQIDDESLDFAYVDGDHTLRGVSIDLIRVFPKVKVGGFIAGDDFCRSIWQHKEQFEPTLVFPFAVYFAEAVGARIYALPHRQMLIEKVAAGDFLFTDLTGKYDALDLRSQIQLKPDAPAPKTPPAAPASTGSSARRRLAHVRRSISRHP